MPIKSSSQLGKQLKVDDSLHTIDIHPLYEVTGINPLSGGCKTTTTDSKCWSSIGMHWIAPWKITDYFFITKDNSKQFGKWDLEMWLQSTSYFIQKWQRITYLLFSKKGILSLHFRGALGNFWCSIVVCALTLITVCFVLCPSQKLFSAYSAVPFLPRPPLPLPYIYNSTSSWEEITTPLYFTISSKNGSVQEKRSSFLTPSPLPLTLRQSSIKIGSKLCVFFKIYLQLR